MKLWWLPCIQRTQWGGSNTEVVLARRLPTKRDLDSNQLGLYLTQMGIAKLEAIQRWEVGLKLEL